MYLYERKKKQVTIKEYPPVTNLTSLRENILIIY